MKTLIKHASVAMAILLGTTSLAAAASVETLPGQVRAPEENVILVADDEDDRRFWWRLGPHWQYGDRDDDRWDDDDDDRWNDDDDDDGDDDDDD